jgi:hypothetical protein
MLPVCYPYLTYVGNHLGFCLASPLLIEKSELHASGDFEIAASKAPSWLFGWMCAT